jgi:outer membrane lipoprotein-sorting protein
MGLYLLFSPAISYSPKALIYNAIGDMNLFKLKRYALRTLLLGTTLCCTFPHYRAIAAQSAPPMDDAKTSTPGQSPAPVPRATPSQREKPAALQPLTEETTQLLVRSLQSFFNSAQMETKSQFQIEGAFGAIGVKMSGQNRNILKAPNLFRTEFEFQDPTDATKAFRKFVLISNGKTLWTYRPDTNQYSMQPYQALSNSPSKKAPNTSLPSNASAMSLGFISLSYINLRDKFLPILSNNTDSSTVVQKLMQSMDAKESFQFQGYRPLEGQGDMAIYRLNIKVTNKDKRKDLPKDPSMDLWIHPKNEKIVRIQFNIGFNYTKTQNINVQIQENLLQQNSLPSVSADAFYFTPPKGARLVKTLQFMPF